MVGSYLIVIWDIVHRGNKTSAIRQSSVEIITQFQLSTALQFRWLVAGLSCSLLHNSYIKILQGLLTTILKKGFALSNIRWRNVLNDGWIFFPFMEDSFHPCLIICTQVHYNSMLSPHFSIIAINFYNTMKPYSETD